MEKVWSLWCFLLIMLVYSTNAINIQVSNGTQLIDCAASSNVSTVCLVDANTVIDLTTQLLPSDVLTIRGQGNSIIDLQYLTRLVNTTFNVTLIDLEIRKGVTTDGLGGFIYSRVTGFLNLTNVLARDMYGTVAGGAISGDSGAQGSFKNVSIVNATTNGNSGASVINFKNPSGTSGNTIISMSGYFNVTTSTVPGSTALRWDNGVAGSILSITSDPLKPSRWYFEGLAGTVWLMYSAVAGPLVYMEMESLYVNNVASKGGAMFQFTGIIQNMTINIFDSMYLHGTGILAAGANGASMVRIHVGGLAQVVNLAQANFIAASVTDVGFFSDRLSMDTGARIVYSFNNWPIAITVNKDCNVTDYGSSTYPSATSLASNGIFSMSCGFATFTRVSGFVLGAIGGEANLTTTSGDLVFQDGYGWYNTSVAPSGAQTWLSGGVLWAYQSTRFMLSAYGSILFKNYTSGFALGSVIYASNTSFISITSQTGNISFIDSKVTEIGGAISLQSGSSLSLSAPLGSISFINGVAGETGGAISLTQVSSLSATARNLIFQQNSASLAGGAIAVFDNSTFNFSTSSSCYFTSNSASDPEIGLGGAIFVSDSSFDSSLLLPSSTSFTNNSAAYGGAVAIPWDQYSDIENAYFAYNSASIKGCFFYASTCNSVAETPITNVGPNYRLYPSYINTWCTLIETSCVDPTQSECPPPAPSPAAHCDNGIWEVLLPEYQTYIIDNNTTHLIVGAPIDFIGNISLTIPTLTISDIFNLSMSPIVRSGSCLNISHLNILLTQHDSDILANQTSDRTVEVLQTTCNVSGTIVNVIGNTNRSCQQLRTSSSISGDATTLYELFSVDSSKCSNNVWWIILVCVLAAVLLLVIIVVITFMRCKKARRAIIPYENANT